MNCPGLLRLRALAPFMHKGELKREGDVLLVYPTEARDLLAWGRCEATPQAEAKLYGGDPWTVRAQPR